MILDFIIFTVLLAGAVYLIISNIYYRYLCGEWERQLDRKCVTISRQNLALNKAVETAEFLHKETFDLMGDVLTLETERDYWKTRALAMTREE